MCGLLLYILLFVSCISHHMPFFYFTSFCLLIKYKKSIHPWELVSTGVGILIAVLIRVNIVDLLLVTEGVRWWIGVGITGVIIGRGASFVYSLIGKLQDAGKPVAEVVPLEGELATEEERWGAKEDKE